MEKLDKILAASLTKKKLGKPLKAAQICFYAGLWGKAQMTPVAFSGGILKVSVKSSPAASELEIQKEDLLDFVNEKIGHKAVRVIRIIVKW